MLRQQAHLVWHDKTSHVHGTQRPVLSHDGVHTTEVIVVYAPQWHNGWVGGWGEIIPSWICLVFKHCFVMTTHVYVKQYQRTTYIQRWVVPGNKRSDMLICSVNQRNQDEKKLCCWFVYYLLFCLLFVLEQQHHHVLPMHLQVPSTSIILMIVPVIVTYTPPSTLYFSHHQWTDFDLSFDEMTTPCCPVLYLHFWDQ